MLCLGRIALMVENLLLKVFVQSPGRDWLLILMILVYGDADDEFEYQQRFSCQDA